MRCPDCSKAMIGVEYDYLHPEHYDGVSEWECSCGVRIGKWTRKRLKGGEVEKKYGNLPKGDENEI